MPSDYTPEQLRTAMINAVQAGLRDDVRDFHKDGGDVNTRDDDGMPILHLAINEREPEIAVLLLELGADPDSRADRTYLSALHYAASRNDIASARALLARKADPNARNNQQQTPLHYAAHEGAIDIARLLIAAGGDLFAKDRDGRTPYDMAADRADISQPYNKKYVDVMNEFMEETKRAHARAQKERSLQKAADQQSVLRAKAGGRFKLKPPQP